MNDNNINLEPINRELAAVWPDWTAVKLLGKGASGAVYEIHRYVRSNLEKAAMKVIRVPESDADAERLQFQGMTQQDTEEYYERFVDSIHNEIRIMQGFVGNSHIVSYEDYAIRKREDRIGWDIYLRMELLTGLREYIQNNPMEERTVFKLGADILQALRDCHKSGIIHRDIKPANIFVNKAGNFKLGDFGVARTAPDISDTLSFKGTFGYMAPEVYLRMATDERSDLYSLGLVLYQCLNDNRLPFVPKGFTPEDISEARKKRFAGEKIPEPTHGSKGLKAIVLKSLAYQPKDRYQTAQEMYSALEKAYRGEYEGKPAVRTEGGDDDDSVTVAIVPRERGNAGQGGVDELLSKNAKPILILALVVVVAAILYFNRKPPAPVGGGSDHPTGETKEVTVADQPTGETTEVTVVEQPTGETNKGAVVEQEGKAQGRTSEAPGEQEVTDFAIEWDDEVLEQRMREITGIDSGDIMYSDVQNITELHLSDYSGDRKIRNIDALSNLTNLKSLDLSLNEIKDINALKNLSDLEALFLEENQITDISALSGLTKLEVLFLEENQITDISALSELTELKMLVLYHNQITDISVLSKLNKLEDLALQSNKVKDINALSGLSNLEALNLLNNQIEDINALKNLTKLKELYLGNNLIKDCSPIGELTKLESLFLNDNQISDISALGKLTNLETLLLRGNQITDISTLSNLTKLESLDLRDNPISDYSPIKDLNIKDLEK